METESNCKGQGMSPVSYMTYGSTTSSYGDYTRPMGYIPAPDAIWPKRKQPMHYVCTFGSGQKYADRYVTIHAYDEQEARYIMNKEFGQQWSMIYTPTTNKTAEELAGVKEFNLKRLLITEVQRIREEEAYKPKDLNPIEGVY